MTELSVNELDGVSGGFWGYVVAAVIISAGIYFEGLDALSERPHDPDMRPSEMG